MGRTNYSKMSTQKIKEQDELTVKEPVNAESEVDEECAACVINLDEPEVKEESDSAIGNVQNCTRLNVRAKPNIKAAILEVLTIGDDVDVDEKSIGKPWLKVTTAKGTVGYCMKEYIVIV